MLLFTYVRISLVCLPLHGNIVSRRRVRNKTIRINKLIQSVGRRITVKVRFELFGNAKTFFLTLIRPLKKKCFICTKYERNLLGKTKRILLRIRKLFIIENAI